MESTSGNVSPPVRPQEEGDWRTLLDMHPPNDHVSSGVTISGRSPDEVLPVWVVSPH